MESVRLKYAESESFSPGGGVTGAIVTLFEAKVINLAFAKDVAVEYRKDDGSWDELTLSWQGNYGDYDVFAGKSNTFITSRFALRYSVNGQIYWDNNGGTDYVLNSSGRNTVGGNVVLGKAIARRGTEAGGGFVFTTSWVEGEILVRNLTYAKRIGIRLTANDWQTFADTDASYTGTVDVYDGLTQVECWKFKTPEYNLNTASSVYRFSIYYNDLTTGAWFWDNNFGRNYTLSREDLSSSG